MSRSLQIITLPYKWDMVAYNMVHEINLGSYAILIFYGVDGPCMLT